MQCEHVDVKVLTGGFTSKTRRDVIKKLQSCHSGCHNGNVCYSGHFCEIPAINKTCAISIDILSRLIACKISCKGFVFKGDQFKVAFKSGHL